jgi:hypothetical protein
MPKISIIIGILLIILGLAGYFGTGGVSVTALIPAFFGIVIAILGFLGKKENIRKHVMHVALLVALLGVIGSFAGIPKTVTLMGGGEIVRPGAAIAQAIMALICIAYLIIGIQSFIKARLERRMAK